MYERKLAECDVILWVIDAHERDLSRDEAYFKRLKLRFDRIVLAVNRIDEVGPARWISALPTADVELRTKIDEIAEGWAQQPPHRPAGFDRARPAESFRKGPLYTEVLATVSPQRRWLFSTTWVDDEDDGFEG